MQLEAKIDQSAYRQRYGEYLYNDFRATIRQYLSHVALELQLDEGSQSRGVYHFRGVTIDATFGIIQNPTPDYVAYANMRLATCEGEKRMLHVAQMLKRQIPELHEIGIS